MTPVSKDNVNCNYSAYVPHARSMNTPFTPNTKTTNSCLMHYSSEVCLFFSKSPNNGIRPR